LDLSQTATLEASNNLAQEVLNELRSTGKVHKRDVQSAGFVVLKSPDIPSVLVETAFISNPQEEKKLSHPVHQQRLAEALMNGIRDYFGRYPPPGTLLAENQAQEHVISRGDTLSTIAKRYRVSLNSLMEANGLSGDRIRPGQVLRIPGG
jgi:N-acetylmuramoyl-L-alanine amidase